MSAYTKWTFIALVVAFLAARVATSEPASTSPASAPTTASQPTTRYFADDTFFTPPEKYKGQMGDLRSAMKFDDGKREVTKPEDWPARRDEIRKYWFGKIGAWPELVEKPQVKMGDKERVENFTRIKVQVELVPKAMEDAYLLIPDGKGPFPAVVVVFYDPNTPAGVNIGDNKNLRNMAFGLDLAQRGFVALCIGEAGHPNSMRSMQPLSFLAYVAANARNALAQMPEVDPKKIGIIGHSYGGKWAMFASCLNDKFACAVWCDPGIIWNEKDGNANYWEDFYLGYDPKIRRERGLVTEANPRTGAYKELVAEKHDMNELHALMAPRPFLVSGGDQDRIEHWTALNHAIALNKFLGYNNRVAMTMRTTHVPTPESREQMYQFFEKFLKGE